MSDSDSSHSNASPLSEDQRKHLDLIQAALNRMAGGSSTAKGWLLPVVATAYGYALTRNAESIAALGLGAVALFLFLDAHYLRQERAFRVLHRAAVEGAVAPYDMNVGRYFLKPVDGLADDRDPSCSWKRIFLSWSIGGFYFPMFLAGMAVALRAAAVNP